MRWWPFERARWIPVVPDHKRDEVPLPHIPPLPKHIIEMVTDQLAVFLDEPDPASAFVLGVACEYAGHFDPEVSIAADLFLELVLRDAADDFTFEERLAIRALLDSMSPI